MRVPYFSDILCITLFFLSVVLFATVRFTVADVGGSAKFATPWIREGPKNIMEIEKAKDLATTYQTLTVSSGPGEENSMSESTTLINVNLVPSPFHEGDDRLYVLTGKTTSGETVAISFSQIESFSVISKEDKKITLSVTIWPDISSEELLQKQPSYKDLFAGYRRDVVLNLDLELADGRVQIFDGKWKNITLPLRKFQVGDKGSFYEEHPHKVHPLRFWWAIPSVFQSEDYPFRVIFLK